MLNKLLAFLRSRKFFAAIIVLFVLQGIFFAVAVNPSSIYVIGDGTVTRGGGVVPDGNRHIGAIYYFAQQPIQNGPFITDMTDSELWMGDLERFPSYFYYYVVGFFVRISMMFGASDIANVMVIRLVGLAFGVATLFVFRKIAAEITSNKVVIHLATLGLALTGSFAWLAPAENYDVLALLFFLLFMLSTIRLFTKKDPAQLYSMVLWLCIGSITKYTYLPFMLLFAAVAVVLYVRRIGTLKKALSYTKQKLRSLIQSTNKAVLVICSVILLAAMGLFIERIGGNVVTYQAISPLCSTVHSHEACMNFGVYERNYNRQQRVDAGEFNDYSFNPAQFTGLWIYKYYTSMYAYVGHIWIDKFSIVMYVGAFAIVGALIAMIAYLKVRKTKIVDTITSKFALFVVTTFVALQYLFNANTYINTGGVAYATQGRYLLPAIGFVYILLLVVGIKFYRAVPDSKKQLARCILIMLAVVAIATNSALVTFWLHATTPEWFSWT